MSPPVVVIRLVAGEVPVGTRLAVVTVPVVDVGSSVVVIRLHVAASEVPLDMCKSFICEYKRVR